MEVVKLEEYRRAKKIQEIPEEKEDARPAKEKLKEHLKEKLRQRLRERMRLQKLRDKQSKTSTKEPPLKPS